MSSNVLIEIFAESPPAILIALSFVLLFIGFTTNFVSIINVGWIFLALGVVLQVLWLLVMAKR